MTLQEQAVSSVFKKQEILKLDPYNFHVLNHLGNICQDQHKFDEAIDCYQKAIQINPTFAWC
jgi:tetratricopeptide (TPR) repeat protein